MFSSACVTSPTLTSYLSPRSNGKSSAVEQRWVWSKVCYDNNDIERLLCYIVDNVVIASQIVLYNYNDIERLLRYIVDNLVIASQIFFI